MEEKVRISCSRCMERSWQKRKEPVFRGETAQAIRDLGAAENQLMCCFLAAVKEANTSAGLLEMLEENQAVLRTILQRM